MTGNALNKKLSVSTLLMVISLMVIAVSSVTVCTEPVHADPITCQDITTKILSKAGGISLGGSEKSSETDDYCSWSYVRLGNVVELVDIYFSGEISHSISFTSIVRGKTEQLRHDSYGCKQGALINGRSILVRAITCNQASRILEYLLIHES